MRIVLDTNVLLRALVSPAGPAGETLRLIRSPHVLLSSPAMLNELARVLAYPRIQLLHGMTALEIEDVLTELQGGTFLVPDPPLRSPPVVRVDPEDDVVIATAIVGQADVVCTLDRHFREPDVVDCCSQHGIRIVTDIERLSELRA